MLLIVLIAILIFAIIKQITPNLVRTITETMVDFAPLELVPVIVLIGLLLFAMANIINPIAETEEAKAEVKAEATAKAQQEHDQAIATATQIIEKRNADRLEFWRAKGRARELRNAA